MPPGRGTRSPRPAGPRTTRRHLDPEAVDDRQGERQPDAHGAAVPGRLSTSMVPRSALTLRLTTSMPTPRPDRLLTAWAVEKPGSKISVEISWSVRAVPGSTRPRSIALARTASCRCRRRRRYLDDDAARVVEGVQAQGPLRGLPRAPRCSADSMPWSSGVAHEVHQRVADLLHDGLVHLRVAAVDHQLDVLAQIGEMSRTTRWKRLKVSPIGTMRSSGRCRGPPRPAASPRPAPSPAPRRR